MGPQTPLVKKPIISISYIKIGGEGGLNSNDSNHRKSIRNRSPYTEDDFVRDTEGMTVAQMERLLKYTPRLGPGEKWCRGRDGHKYTVQEAHLTQTTDVYTALFVETVIDTLAAGGEIYVIKSNGKYVNISYHIGWQLYNGWVNYADISITQ